ncbi:formyltransferase [Variovorax sp. J22R133]|uniref:formyltransferase n=1 Tax=Variovorax brevis TaxID=3053503 RepID=UPI00257506C2|nr:formyltransferase [Variovorax sp. J22R133]MDM0114059.1 formyltransferase [Variovorax sp. J22R133]
MSNAARRAPRAIVFAYHDVGVRCLRAVLDAGIDVALVVTHADAPDETIWFASVAQVAQAHGLRCVMPDDPHDQALLDAARALEPDFLFSFYYRKMLGREWIDLPSRGAFNMHGSLLPKYRGRAPVNWAVIHGERETGATLHRMNEKPDNGSIVDQCAVPILADDTAHDVFGKVTVAAEIVMVRSLPRLIDGTAVERAQDLSQGRYFGGRKPEDGRIPGDANAGQIHDLVRALAPPYPCAFVHIAGQRVLIERTRREAMPPEAPGQGLRMLVDAQGMWLMAADGSGVRVLGARVTGARCGDAGHALDAHEFETRFGARCIEVDG